MAAPTPSEPSEVRIVATLVLGGAAAFVVGPVLDRAGLLPAVVWSAFVGLRWPFPTPAARRLLLVVTAAVMVWGLVLLRG